MLFGKYAKNFLIILLSLVGFFVFIDFIFQRQHLPDSTNLQFLFMFYRAVYALNLFYPLSLVFALLATVLALIRTNELIAFFSIGYSLKRLLFPFVLFAFLITSILISLQFTKMAYVEDYAKSIKSNNYSLSVNNELFFKYKNFVVYIDELNRFTKTAKGMKIFTLRNGRLETTYDIQEAKFEDNYWHTKNGTFITKDSDKMIIKDSQKLYILKGFKPKILDNLEKISLISLSDAIDSLLLLNSQNLDSSKIRVFIYNSIIVPLSFVLLVAIFFLKTPIHSRISNTFVYIMTVLFSSMLLWGFFLILRKMAYNGIVNPEIVFFTPILILISIFIHYFRRV
jgi:lipopolysaccharide export system permease protein